MLEHIGEWSDRKSNFNFCLISHCCWGLWLFSVKLWLSGHPSIYDTSIKISLYNNSFKHLFDFTHHPSTMCEHKNVWHRAHRTNYCFELLTDVYRHHKNYSARTSLSIIVYTFWHLSHVLSELKNIFNGTHIKV